MEEPQKKPRLCPTGYRGHLWDVLAMGKCSDAKLVVARGEGSEESTTKGFFF